MIKKAVITILVLTLLSVPVSALAETYTVQSGDSLWKIAVKYHVGFQEILDANSNLKNPNLIYPNQKIIVPASEEQAISKEVIRLTNIERQKQGLQPLKENWELSRVARHKATEMATSRTLSHTTASGSPFTMIKNYGISYRSAGENIAQGQRTAQEVVTAWMNSSGHRANILNPNYNQIGVGYDGNGNYWSQMFIQK